MKNRSEYEAAAKAKLDAVEKDIKKLKAEAIHVREELVAEHRAKLDELYELNAKAREKFDEMIDAGEDAWKAGQKGMELYWQAIGNELKAYEDMGTKKKK